MNNPFDRIEEVKKGCGETNEYNFNCGDIGEICKEPILCEKCETELATLIECRDFVKDSIVIPCCHTSGMHDPRHFDDKTKVCSDQLKECFIRFLNKMGIDDVIVESDKDCYWCNYGKTHPEEEHNHAHRKYLYSVKDKKIKELGISSEEKA